MTGGMTYNDGYIILHLIRYGEMPAFKFTTDEKGHIDPDEADRFLAHYSEIKFDAEFYRHLIIANIFKERNDRALELHAVLSEKYPLTANDYGFRSILSVKAEHLSEAQSDAAKAIEMDPENVFAHFALGLIYIEHNEKQRALEHLDRAGKQKDNIYGYEASLERARALN
jgi:tetratricopeptide (TPR) repeat protein